MHIMYEVLGLGPSFSQINATKLNIPNLVAKSMVNTCILYLKMCLSHQVLINVNQKSFCFTFAIYDSGMMKRG